MATTQEASFNDQVEQFLGARLPRQLAESVPLPDLPPEAQGFIMRMLSLMKRAGCLANGFNPILNRWLSTTIPSVLPGAWGGRIPPLTLPGRHRKLDAYVAGQQWSPGNEPPIYVDVGCGFPPVTPADTARTLPKWHIYGVDRSFAAYVLYDADGHYACFDHEGNFQYFQALMNASGRALYADAASTRSHFKRLFADLLPLLEKPDATASETVEKDGNKLIHNHILDFELDNLTLIKSDIAELNLPPAKVIRCMNVLIYFRPEIRAKMLLQMERLLDSDGILITGTNGLGMQARYAVYHNGADGLYPKEFAFSLDNIGHIVFMPWFTIHEDDPEAKLLADLTGTIRSDRSFWNDFSQRLDTLLEEQEICRRARDGFLHFPNLEMSPEDYMSKNVIVWQQIFEEEYSDRAVHVLKQKGYEAWVNPVGDISVRPESGSLS